MSDDNTLTHDEAVNLYWEATGDNWAIPESIMVKFARAVEAKQAARIAELETERDKWHRIADQTADAWQGVDNDRIRLQAQLAAEKVQRETLATQYYASATGLQTQLDEATKTIESVASETLTEAADAWTGDRPVDSKFRNYLRARAAEYRKKATS